MWGQLCSYLDMDHISSLFESDSKQDCVMTLRLLAALLPHGNKRCSESSRHLIRGCPYTATGKMHIYGNRYFLSTGAVGTCETGRVLICTSLSHVSKGLRDRHSGVRESHVMLSNVCESLRDRRRSASCSLALRYKFARL